MGLACVLAAGSARAQEGVEGDFAEPSAEQRRLNGLGTKAYKEQRYEDAVGFYKEALTHGPLNIVYLNLARTQQRLGQCLEAELGFRLALAAPPVKSPEPAWIRERVEEFRALGVEECAGTLAMTCELEGMKVWIDGVDEVECVEQELRLSYGVHRLMVVAWGLKREVEVEIKPRQSTAVRLTLGITPREAQARALTLEAGEELGEGDLSSARELLLEARRKDPNWWQPVALLGEIAAREGKLDEAREMFTLALPMTPEEIRGDVGKMLQRVARQIEARDEALTPGAVAEVRDQGLDTRGPTAVVLGLGAASVLVGGVSHLLLRDTNEDIKALGSQELEAGELGRARRLLSRGQAQEQMVHVGYGVGAGLLSAALVLWSLDESGDILPFKFNLLPAWMGQGAGVSVAW